MVISRRALLATGIGTAAAAGALTVVGLAHRLDDLARTVGVRPKPQPDPADDLLIAAVAEAQNTVLGAVEATGARHAGLTAALKPFVAIGREHVEAVGGSATVPRTDNVAASQGAAVDALAKTYSAASKARATDAGKAVSPDLARVLSSMSAGLAQCAQAVGDLR